MKLLVAGSRELRNRQEVYSRLNWCHAVHPITELVTGMALYWLWDKDPDIGGPDRYGYDWAKMNGVDIKEFCPNWSQGKSAGIRRNTDMADYADQAYIFWDCVSTGTQDMREQMLKRGKIVTLFVPDKMDFE